MNLKEVFPNGNFRPAATEADVSKVENALGIQIPNQVRKLYFQSDGFREDVGNAKYLFSLIDEDNIGSALSTTKFLWDDKNSPDFSGYYFFGMSCGDEYWGINTSKPFNIISYHHHMHDEYEEIGTSLKQVYLDDYRIYDDLD